MRPTLKVGIEHTMTFRVTDSQTVPALYPGCPEFEVMPVVFATGFLVGLFERTCIRALMPYLDWPQEQSVGTGISISHEAATPPGLEVTARVRLIEIDGRRLTFEVAASDGIDVISRGTHERFVIDRKRFVEKAAKKAETALLAPSPSTTAAPSAAPSAATPPAASRATPSAAAPPAAPPPATTGPEALGDTSAGSTVW